VLDWLIVGGGVHGTHLSLVLLEAGVPRSRLRVIDPYPEPLARWRECTGNTGMSYLRSPVVHHIGARPFDLRQFGRTPEGVRAGAMRGRFKRPALSLFDLHAREVVAAHRLDELRLRGRVTGVVPRTGGLQVETDFGALSTRRLLLAIGLSEQPRWPAWATVAREAGRRVHHLFDPGFDLTALPAAPSAVVVGAGMSGAQCALRLAGSGWGEVALVTRGPTRIHPFDASPGWIGPRLLGGFHRETNPDARREIIRGARYRGSLTPEVGRALRQAVSAGRIALRGEEINGIEENGKGTVIRFVDGPPAPAEMVFLATGFEERRPGGAWLDRAVEELGLPVAGCGFPVVARTLHWGAGVHVAGPLAELEIGPVARNIVGARMAGERNATAA
jgi:cation diffusion facilitator CzcD-associated flavoprotein CzcO